MKTNTKVMVLRILALVGSIFLFLEDASLLTCILLFFAVDYAIYLQFADDLKSEKANKELSDLVFKDLKEIAATPIEVEDLKKLKQIDSSEITTQAEQKGFMTIGPIIGKFADQPIYESIKDVDTGEILTYVGAITHSDVDNMIQMMMAKNEYAKAVRLDSGLIYAIKKEAA